MVDVVEVVDVVVVVVVDVVVVLVVVVGGSVEVVVVVVVGAGAATSVASSRTRIVRRHATITPSTMLRALVRLTVLRPVKEKATATCRCETSDALPTVDVVTTPAEALSPVQQRTLDVLRRSGDPVVFDESFVSEMRTEMRIALDDFAGRLDDGDVVFVSKHRIASVLDCEEHHLQPDEFEWTAANAKGTVAHRAIELLLSWPKHRSEPSPIDLVDEALERMAGENRGISQWVNSLSAADEADVRGQTTVRVTQFLENFPPLRKQWAPVTEASIRWPGSGPITLSGKVDLLFGRPQGRESRKVIIDLKTGRPNVRHRQDLGFYAVLETLVREIPPRKVATFYLDAAEAHADDVSEPMLTSAVRRTLDGINAMIELETEGRPPVRRPGASCRWCPISDSCEEGQAYLTGRADLDSVG